MLGEIGILNVGLGDTKISFDPNNPQDCIRAARIVKDMLRRGYALLVAEATIDGAPPVYRRAYDFDEKTCEYIIADLDPLITQKVDAHDKKSADASAPANENVAAPATGKARTRQKKQRRIPAANATGVAVARTAGG
jgi:hypothetical protein